MKKKSNTLKKFKKFKELVEGEREKSNTGSLLMY